MIVSGILVKLLLGIYVKKKGKLVNSDTLIASGVDALNDAIVSIFCFSFRNYIFNMEY